MIATTDRRDYVDACGRPIVAFDSEDYRALVLDTETGRLRDAEPPLRHLDPTLPAPTAWGAA